MTIILVILALLVGLAGGVALATFVDSQLSKMSFGKQFSAENTQALTDLKTAVTSVEAKVESLLHITTNSTTGITGPRS
jgi:hypothetical protein